MMISTPRRGPHGTSSGVCAGSRLLTIERMAVMGAIVRPGPRVRPYHAHWVLEIPGTRHAVAFPPGLLWDACDRLFVRYLAEGWG